MTAATRPCAAGGLTGDTMKLYYLRPGRDELLINNTRAHRTDRDDYGRRTFYILFYTPVKGRQRNQW